jgi:predicted transcriptional regulator
MVKDINKKRKKGIPHLPKHGHRTRFTEISDFRQAFLELKILFYLKEHDVVAPSHLAIEILRVGIKNSNQICKNLIKQKLIVEQHPTPKSKNYAKTEKGTKLCMKILNWINGEMDNTGLKWVDLVLKLRKETEKDIEQ